MTPEILAAWRAFLPPFFNSHRALLVKPMARWRHLDPAAWREFSAELYRLTAGAPLGTQAQLLDAAAAMATAFWEGVQEEHARVLGIQALHGADSAKVQAIHAGMSVGEAAAALNTRGSSFVGAGTEAGVDDEAPLRPWVRA